MKVFLESSILFLVIWLYGCNNLSNNDECIRRLLDETGVDPTQAERATHLVVIPGYGCSSCIKEAIADLHVSEDTLYILICKSEKDFFLLTHSHLKDIPNAYIDTQNVAVTLELIKKGPMIYTLEKGRFISRIPFEKQPQTRNTRPQTQLSVSKSELNWGTFSRHISKKETLILTNTGSDSLQIDDIILSCDCLRAEYAGRLIPPGDTLHLNVIFKSDSIGDFVRDVNIYGNFPEAPKEIVIKGVCI